MSEKRKLTEVEKAYKEITENPIVIDLGEWKSYYDIFGLLKEKLGLPDFCGKNWYAIGDLARDFSSEPVTIEFHGASDAKKRFPESAKLMIEVFDRIHKAAPQIEYVVMD